MVTLWLISCSSSFTATSSSTSCSAFTSRVRWLSSSVTSCSSLCSLRVALVSFNSAWAVSNCT
ncbi:hypothetical protein EYF80_048292 [Liparis tanakae]|uniref:Secreted protein n=1 Tax=Liparis tanakae TaxID=230148 RepID=A0A4Z2FML0_9TELE|nr:hypothetical protein EYF80_048292 [Liparis tanakae]